MLNEDLVEKISKDLSIEVYWKDFVVLESFLEAWLPFSNHWVDSLTNKGGKMREVSADGLGCSIAFVSYCLLWLLSSYLGYGDYLHLFEHRFESFVFLLSLALFGIGNGFSIKMITELLELGQILLLFLLFGLLYFLVHRVDDFLIFLDLFLVQKNRSLDIGCAFVDLL